MGILELLSILELGIIFSIVSIAIFITFRVSNIADMTVDGSFASGSLCALVMINSGASPIVSLIVAFIIGSLAGLMTYVITFYFKINGLLAGIITSFMLYSINLRITSGIPNIVSDSSLLVFNGILPLLLLSAIVAILIISLSWIFNTEIGLAWRASGQNALLSKIYGIPVNLYLLLSMLISNGLVGLAGALFAHYQGFADISMGQGTLIIGLTGLILGEILCLNTYSISIKLGFCVIGSILYKLVVSYALKLDNIGITSSDLNLVTGVLIIFIIQVPNIIKKIR